MSHARSTFRHASTSVPVRGLWCAVVVVATFLAVGAWWLPARGEETASSDSDNLPSSAMSDADIIAFINEQLRQGWKDANLTPSAPAPDNEWCRRVYLDVIGRVPSVEEINAFVADRSKDKKEKLIDQLLGEEEPYIEDYAEHWANVWSFRLVGRPPANPNRDNPTSRDGMLQYLRTSFLRNKPHSTMAYELISATGTTTPGEPDYNGAVNFLIGKLKENATEATSRTARYFLGLQVQCTQCHNHPFNEWKQDQFWSMNAFFRQTDMYRQRKGNAYPSARLLNQDFAGEGATPKEAEIYYELRNGTVAVAYPTFVDGTKIDPSGYINDVNRREELAKLIIKSDYFGKAMVNFMWSQFFGYGFTKPVDDLGPHNAPSHPVLLDRLGREFALHGHDVKRLIRWLTLSDAYGLSSRMNRGNLKDDPTLGEKPRFSHFYMRQMQPEQLFDSLLVATRADQNSSSGEEQEREREAWLRQFTTLFDNDEGDSATTFNGTIPQALMMMNGSLTHSAISIDKGSFLQNLAASGIGQSEMIEHLYLAALGRRPNPNDMKTARALIASRGADIASAYQDIWWALLNSNEFIFIY